MKNQAIKEIVVAYQETQNRLYQDLATEFKDDLQKWDASLDEKRLSISFNSPDVLFAKGKSILNQKFKVILNDFCPRYLNLIKQKYEQDVDEIRIEGYTDSDGIRGRTKEQNYFYNMRLSQNRTLNVLQYCFNLVSDKANFNWLVNNITSNGLSFSHLKFDSNGSEDKKASRRVEFRVKTKADSRIAKIIEEVN